MIKSISKHILLSFISLFISQVLWSQNYDIDDINLSWRNFTKKDVAVNSRVAAQTHVKIDIDYSLNSISNRKDELTINLAVTQSRDESWVSRQFLMKASDADSRKLLNHEKLHYIINLIGFKKLYNEMKDYNFSSDYKSEITSIFKKYTKEIDKLNSDYDKQTKHGTIVRNQSKWEEQIMDMFNDQYMHDKKIKTQYTIKKIIE